MLLAVARRLKTPPWVGASLTQNLKNCMRHHAPDAENVAEQFNVNRADQDQFALVSQQRTASAQARGFFLKKLWQLKSLSVRAMLL